MESIVTVLILFLASVSLYARLDPDGEPDSDDTGSEDSGSDTSGDNDFSSLGGSGSGSEGYTDAETSDYGDST